MNSFVLELKLFFSERVSWLLLVVFGAALYHGMQNGSAAHERARDGNEELRSAEFEWGLQVQGVLESQSIDPRQVAQRPSVALLPPAPLGALAIGQSDLLPAHEEISVFRAEKTSAASTELENPSRLMAGRFDLAFVLIWLFPLLLLAAVYDLCAGDREAGTLRMVLAQGTSPRVWMLRRALARGLPLIALAAVATLFTGESSDATDAGARAGFAALVVIAYGLFWLALAALVNTYARSASTAATALGASWVLFVLVLPTLLNIVVESLHPSPSRAELVAEARAAASDAEKRGLEIVSSFYKDHPELAPPGMQADMISRLLAIQEDVGRAMEPVKERFDTAVLDQQRVVERWRFASPAIAAHEALTDLSGTGYWRYRAFQDQVGVFKEQVLAFYGPKFHKRLPLQKSDLPNIPSFTFVEEPRSSWTARVILGITGILLLALLAGFVASARLSPTRLAL